ncbi:MAG: hypothetical protein IJB79_04095 [Candidatus Gastranaerophilales bacterium]|nr:hypothetical protein [Candidatus Gastranaerophilales bacterium]
MKKILNEDLLNSKKYENFSIEQLKEEYINLKKDKENQNLKNILLVTIEAIKQVYEYEININDLEKLNFYLNNTSIDISNTEAFYSFLLYSAIKDSIDEQVHVLFIDDFLARKYYLQSNKLYETLGIKAAFNLIFKSNAITKFAVFDANIIFSDWKRIIWEYICNINTQKVAQRPNFKIENVFIFDIDKIIYDYEKNTLKADISEFSPNEIEVKKFIKLYKNIVGVSASLSFENKKIEKNYKIKTKILSKDKEINEKIKNSNEFFYTNKSDKIKHLARQIEELIQNKETAIIDVENPQDLEFLCHYLTLKDIEIPLIDNFIDITDENLLTILTPNKISIITNNLNSSIEAKLGGDWEEIARINTYKTNTDADSNFYKEKLKKEIAQQKELCKKNIALIQDKGGINLIFTSHYCELKHEYAILKNYSNIPIKNIYFYNSAEDEVYNSLKLNNINLFKKQNNKENETLFNIFAKFLFYLRKYATKKLIKQTSEVLYFDTIQDKQEESQNEENKENEEITEENNS